MDFANQRLDGDSSAKIINHLATCADCSRKVAEETPLADGHDETWGSGILEQSEKTWGDAPPLLDDPTDEALAELGAEPTPTDALPTGLHIGRYVLLDRLGMGGLSVVYAAYDHKLDRKIALKLMLPGSGRQDEEGQTRLLREAQALAALAHPNVIAVHDVGTFGDQVFIAEEFVAGGTLTQWLAAEKRSWREIVSVYKAAAKGLAAAHAAGMIHRDFKPDNVLMGEDGRARVSDFGLARALETAEPDGPEPSLASDIADRSLGGSTSGRSSKGALSARLTQTGAMLGTPAYMSLEQLLGRHVDPRTDQFSFCVALFESLYGYRPFEGKTLRQLMSSVATGHIRDIPKDTDVPAWVHRILIRGLAADPDQRWASMDALLHELENDPTIQRRRVAIGAGSVAVLGVLTAAGFFIGRGATDVCGAAESSLAGVWDAPIKAQVQEAFSKSGRPYGADTFTRVEKILDRYTADWVAMSTEACEATHVQGKQSDVLLDRRTACLDRRLAKLGALTTLFAAEPDGEVVDKAVEASSNLATLDACADVDALLAKVPPPEDRAVRKKVEKVRAELDQAEALEHAGRFAEGLAIAEAQTPIANDLHYAPIAAEAEYRRAALLHDSGKFKDALAGFRDASQDAAAARDDELMAESLTEIVQLSGVDLKQHESLEHLHESAEALVIRAGADPLQEARLLSYYGRALSDAGRYKDAEPALKRALALREQRLPPDHLDIAESKQFLGTDLLRLDRPDEARRLQNEAHAIRVAALGEHHVAVAESLLHQCTVEFSQVEIEAALDLCGRALDIFEAALGPTHPRVGKAHDTFGSQLHELGRYAEAQPHFESAVQILEAALGPRHPDLATALNNLSLNLFELGEVDEARQVGERALSIMAGSLGPKHPHLGISQYNLGYYLEKAGSYTEALKYHQRALDTWAGVLEEDHPYYAYALTGVGICKLGLDTPAEAVAPLERALRIREAKPSDPVETARTRFALAQALARTGGDRDRARSLASQARKAFSGAETDESRKHVAEIGDWLAHLDRSSP